MSSVSLALRPPTSRSCPGQMQGAARRASRRELFSSCTPRTRRVTHGVAARQLAQGPPPTTHSHTHSTSVPLCRIGCAHATQPRPQVQRIVAKPPIVSEHSYPVPLSRILPAPSRQRAGAAALAPAGAAPASRAAVRFSPRTRTWRQTRNPQRAHHALHAQHEGRRPSCKGNAT
jgi:hypothetical protein